MTIKSIAEPRAGLKFSIPESLNKDISVVEVGPFNENSKAKEINKFLGTNIEQLNIINTYILIHKKDINNLKSLLSGKPFVDPITHQATLNESLALKLGIPFDYVLQSMLNPGTSDEDGNILLEQSLISLGKKPLKNDLGFYSKQYFLKGNLTKEQLDEVSKFLANQDLNERLIIPRKDYERGIEVEAPVVTLKKEIEIKKYDLLNMSDNELLKLNSKRKLAATLEELLDFRNLYKNNEFINERKKFGLDSMATDVEIETWFGLRSEHCFHKEFNAHITLDDKVNDEVFRMAFEKDWLGKNSKREYTLDRGLFNTFIKDPAEKIFDKLEKRGKNWIVSMFEDNSGVVQYNKKYMLCIKFETHNSPSNKEPVQGAKTGIDGVNRDIFGTLLGTFDAIANFFFYCTGDPIYKGWLPEGVKHPYVLLKGITQGVREGGNECQIPTLGGGLITDPRYIAKCLVYCGTVGWSPVESEDGKSYLRINPRVGDLIFVTGQPVGIDGIHGATESSLNASRKISLGHVQADFSFIQAKMKEYLKEIARDFLLSGITDCGAMGIGSANELARTTGGLELDLSLHPKKYLGIQPWQIECSETQDRMIIAASPYRKKDILRRAKVHDVQVTELGKLTDSGYIHLKYGNETVALIDIKKLFDKEPRKHMHAVWRGIKKENVKIKKKHSLEESLSLVMSRPDVASKEWFFRQKDSCVKGATIQGPLIGLKQEVEADATIQKPLDTQGEDNGAIAYSHGIAPKVSDIDPYLSAQKSFVDMVGKIIAVGGALPSMKNPKWDAWAVCGNYCQPNSDSMATLTKESGEHNLASLVREGIGIAEAIEKLNIPVISGKDSMKCSCTYEVGDSFKLEDVPVELREHITIVEDKKKGKKSIEIHNPDTYLASAAVKIQDYRKCVNSAFKENGDLIYILGTTKNHLGGSQYLDAINYDEKGAPIKGGEAPKTDFDEFIDLCAKVNSAINNETVASCSYIHDGGIAVVISKAAIAGNTGASIDLRSVRKKGCNSDEELIYSETPGRFIVSIAPDDKERFEEIMGKSSYRLIGEVKSKNISVKNLNEKIEKINLSRIKESYQKPLSFDLNKVSGK